MQHPGGVCGLVNALPLPSALAHSFYELAEQMLNKRRCHDQSARAHSAAAALASSDVFANTGVSPARLSRAEHYTAPAEAHLAITGQARSR